VQDACDLAHVYTVVHSVRMGMQQHSSPMSTTTRCMGRFAAAVPLRAVIRSEWCQLSAPKCACPDDFDAGDLRLSDCGVRFHSNTPAADYVPGPGQVASARQRSMGMQANAIACGHSTVHVQPLVMCCSWRKHVQTIIIQSLSSIIRT
jgi:hypothetical protein